MFGEKEGRVSTERDVSSEGIEWGGVRGTDFVSRWSSCFFKVYMSVSGVCRGYA